MTRRLVLLTAGLLAATRLQAGIPETVDFTQIPTYRRIGPDLALAGQPAPDALKQLKDMGFKTVINLRTEKEGAADERAVVEAQGLHYVWVPMTPDTFSLKDVEAVEAVLADPAAGPILLHCASSNRVGGAWAVIQARRGKSLEEAEAAGRAAGLLSAPMIDAVRRVLGVPGPAAAPPPPNP
jgi:uncharacterized protein (TIGR01244 family)